MLEVGLRANALTARKLLQKYKFRLIVPANRPQIITKNLPDRYTERMLLVQHFSSTCRVTQILLHFPTLNAASSNQITLRQSPPCLPSSLRAAYSDVPITYAPKQMLISSWLAYVIYMVGGMKCSVGSLRGVILVVLYEQRL